MKRADMTPEEAPLDPWAEQMLLNERRASKQLDWEIEKARAELRARHERRMSIWSGVGWVSLVAVVVGGILAIIFWGISNAEFNRTNKLETQQERTEQVEACVSLTEPIERQYCLLSLGVQQDSEEDDG